MDAALFSSPTWFYIDSDGYERGPFRGEDMLGWYSDGYFPSHLLVRRNIHSNFTTLYNLAIGNALEPIVNVHPAEKLQKEQEAKSSEISPTENEEEYVEREIQEECIKTEIKVECFKPEIKKEHLEPQIKECAIYKIKKDASKSTKTFSSETEYIETEMSKDWLKLESKEECIKMEIKEECKEWLKLERKEKSIKTEIKEKCIKLEFKGSEEYLYLTYLNPELKKEYRIKIEHIERKMKEEFISSEHVREVPDSLANVIKDIYGNPLIQEEITNGILNKRAESSCNEMEDGEIPSSPPPPPVAHSISKPKPITEYQRGEKRKLEKESETQCEKKEKPIIERDTNNLPTFKVNHVTVCSTTLWIGHVSKLVEKEDLFNIFRQYGEVISIDLIHPRGCAFVKMKRRTDAEKALEKLRIFRLCGKQIKIAWAPEKRAKDNEWKDFFDFNVGAFFIPLEKLDSWLRLSMVD